MKISILKESLGIGGMERSASNFSCALSKKHEVTTVLYYSDIMAYPYGGKLYNMELPAKKSKSGKLVNNFRRAICYKRHIREFNPDIAFQFLMLRSPVGFLKLKNSVKIVSGRDFSAVSRDHKLFKKRLDTSDAMICNSNYIKDFFVEKYPEDKKKVFTVQNIINVDFIKIQAEEKAEESFLEFKKNHTRLIVSVGRFCKEKAFEHLISAFSKVHKVMSGIGLVLVGDGEYKERYNRTIDELGLTGDVYFTGYQINPYKYMSKCDLFVLSSLSEGFPNVLAEAMALSVPVISVNCFSGPAEILMDDYDYEIAKDSFVECDYGVLTPSYNVNGIDFAVEKMSEAIVHMLSNEKLMQKYGALSVERAEEFSASSAVKKLEDVFETLVSRKLGYQSSPKEK